MNKLIDKQGKYQKTNKERNTYNNGDRKLSNSLIVVHNAHPLKCH